jgi:hypothetical protein
MGFFEYEHEHEHEHENPTQINSIGATHLGRFEVAQHVHLKAERRKPSGAGPCLPEHV